MFGEPVFFGPVDLEEARRDLVPPLVDVRPDERLGVRVLKLVGDKGPMLLPVAALAPELVDPVAIHPSREQVEIGIVATDGPQGEERGEVGDPAGVEEPVFRGQDGRMRTQGVRDETKGGLGLAGDVGKGQRNGDRKVEELVDTASSAGQSQRRPPPVDRDVDRGWASLPERPVLSLGASAEESQPGQSVGDLGQACGRGRRRRLDYQLERIATELQVSEQR
jgi:hypothetical protein